MSRQSGYNGNFGEYGMIDGPAGEAARKNAMGLRPDGTDYVWTKYTVPNRLYIGKKGVASDGTPDTTGFLARNGLAYGQIFGFATNMDETTDGLYMDAFSKVAPAGTVVRCVPQLVPSLRPGHALCVDAAVTMLILP